MTCVPSYKYHVQTNNATRNARGNKTETIMTKKNLTTTEPVVTETETPEVEVITPPTPHTVEQGSIHKRSSFGKTFYYIDPERTRSAKGPNQLKGIVKWMLDNDVTSPANARQGSEIGRLAVEDGYVVTAKLTGEVIFAYYVREMQKNHGMEHAATLHAKTGKRMN